MTAHFEKTHKQLGASFFTPVKPARFPDLKLRYFNAQAAEKLGLGDLSEPDILSHFGGFKPFEGSFSEPLALHYHGHQFGVYNPDLGDGRGFLFAQIREPETDRLLDFGTKGSGQTPFSRTADGRLTLKGAVREILATELLTALSVPTSQSFCVIETGESLSRHDEPSPTRSAVLTRLSHSHIRIGSFQRCFYDGRTDDIEKLARYVVRHYYPALDPDAPKDQLLSALLRAFMEKVAEMTGHWMASGFVHGVLNTDNFNLTGESFDYGPWRFLPRLEPLFTAAYFDQQRRYAYARQPEAALWALCRLADCFMRPEEAAESQKAKQDSLSQESLTEILADFYPLMEKHLASRLIWRTGLMAEKEADELAFARAFLRFAQKSKLDFDRLFFDSYGQPAHFTDFDLSQLSQSDDHVSDQAEIVSAQQRLAETARCLAPRQPTRPAFFERAEPVSLVIEEVERIWAPIAEQDDWTALEGKLDDIRAYGAALRATS